MNRRRDGERGLSIIEAIVIATITALLALLIMPLLPRASAGSFAVAERGVDALDQMRAEREFRTLIRAISLEEVEGEAQTVIAGSAADVVLRPNLATTASCARSGSPVVRLSIERNALVCTSDGRRRALARWQGDRAGGLSYSADGVAWRAHWADAGIRPFVRFELRRSGRVEASWVERIAGESQ